MSGINIWKNANLRDGDWLNLNSRLLRWQLCARGVGGSFFFNIYSEWFLIGFGDATFLNLC